MRGKVYSPCSFFLLRLVVGVTIPALITWSILVMFSHTHVTTLCCRMNVSGGMRAWPFLQGLHLDHNLIQGSIPPSWGTNSGMASLHNISLTFNKLTGSIPPVWGNDASGRRGFSALESLVLQPGRFFRLIFNLSGPEGLWAGASIYCMQTRDV